VGFEFYYSIPGILVKTENGSRGEQSFREVTIALRCLAPLPLRDSNDKLNITESTPLIKFLEAALKPHLMAKGCVINRFRIMCDDR
jgi:hypothetical protein